MISRRNIRVKVMQCLYSAEADTTIVSEDNAVSLLKKYLNETADLFTFAIFWLQKWQDMLKRIPCTVHQSTFQQRLT